MSKAFPSATPDISKTQADNPSCEREQPYPFLKLFSRSAHKICMAQVDPLAASIQLAERSYKLVQGPDTLFFTHPSTHAHIRTNNASATQVK